MPTCRDTVTGALQALKVIAAGDDPSADDLALGLDAIGDLILEIHNWRGPLLDVDVTAAYVAGENQRVRVQAGFTVTVTLPNSIAMFRNHEPYPYDYGFLAPNIWPPIGYVGAADGMHYRQPRDGTRIEIVAATQALYFYRADINAWTAGTGLTLDAEMPFNNRYASSLDAMVAGRIMDVVAAAEPTPGLLRRIAQGNLALLMQAGVARDPVRAEYF